MLLSVLGIYAAAHAAQGDILYGSSNPGINNRLTIGSNGTCMKSDGTEPLWSSSCGSSGGGSGGGTWSTTTSQTPSELINYSNNTTDIIAAGGNSTSTAKILLDPNTGRITASNCYYDQPDCVYFNGNYAPFQRGLVLYWPLTEATGTDIYDHSTNNVNGTTSLAITTWNTSYFNQGIYGNGVMGLASSSAATAAPVSGMANMTVSIWFLSTTTPSGTNQVLASKHQGGNTGEWLLWLNAASTMEYGVINSSGSRVNLILSDGSVNTDGKWHQLTGTYNGAIMSVYLDGFILGTTTQTGTIQSQPTVPLCLGAIQNGTANCGPSFSYTGDEANFRLYNRALSATEVRQLYMAEKPISAPYTFITGPITSQSSGTSTFTGGIISPCFATSTASTCIVPGTGGGSGTVTSVATNNGLTGGTITTSGTLGLDISSLSTNALLTWNGSILAATGTPTLTVGNLIATSTATSTMRWNFDIGNPTATLNGALVVAGTGVNPPLIVERSSGVSNVTEDGITFTDQIGTPDFAIGTEGTLTNNGQLAAIGGFELFTGQPIPASHTGRLPTTNERLFISNAGQVSISTTSSDALLTIAPRNNSVSYPLLKIEQAPGVASTTYFIVSSQQNSGDVGIGTSSPWAALSVEGISTLGNQAIAGFLTATTSTASQLPYASTTMVTATTASTTNQYISALGTPAGTFLAVDSSGHVIATTTPSGGGGTNFWTLSGSSLFNNSGTNVGIGTTSPWGTLSASSTSSGPALAIEQKGTGPVATFLGGQVSIGSANPNGIISNRELIISNGGSGSAAVSGIYLNDVSNGGAEFINNGGTATLSMNVNGGNIVLNQSSGAGAIVFDENGNERMRISSLGNFGVGTTAPMYELSVATSTSGFNLFSVANNGQVRFGTGTSIPTVSSCGSGAVVDSISNDTSGVVHVGTGLTTACTVTWGSPKTGNPLIFIQDGGITDVGTSVATTTTGFLVTFSGTVAGSYFYYFSPTN